MIEFSAGIVSLYYVYGAAEPEHRCRLPSQIWPNDNQFNPINAQHEACLRQYIPMENGRWDQCHIFNLTISNKSLIDCPNGWVFDRSVFLGLTFTEEASLIWFVINESICIRGSAVAVAVTISRLGAIIAPVIDSSVVEQYLSLTFYVYGSVALAVLLLILLLPETKNVSLGDTDDNTNNKDGTQIIVSPPVNIGDIEI
ncbi:unnamed protein product [Rotaria sordida]|uniref:Uncharacterized protein n=1 Tax=Rotaria sordida TaxID=392033 RepID=A0A819IXR5_9BILA|nr:unnamed protein product [Rotaria sordida]